MRDRELALKQELSSAKPGVEFNLDEVIRSLEEAAEEIEKIDWEHVGLAGNHA